MKPKVKKKKSKTKKECFHRFVVQGMSYPLWDKTRFTYFPSVTRAECEKCKLEIYVQENL